MENPIFIVGLTRCGSTLWHNIISMNTEICRLAEMHFLTPWGKDFRYFCRKHVGDLSIDKNVEKMIELIFSNEAMSGISYPFWRFENIEAANNPNLRKEIYKKVVNSDRSLGSIFKILIEKITHFSGYRKCCVKFPLYINYVPQLLKWYPGCKIIHITRDPRATAMSKTNDPGGTAIIIKNYPILKFFVRKIMIFWVIAQYIWTSKLHSNYRRSFKNYALFRYEDLLAKPEKVIKELYEFLEIDFVPEILDLEKGQHEHQKSSLTGKRQKKINKKAASHWRNVISPFEKWIISLLTKKSMKRFGYDPKNHPVYFND